jgi:hypothetical protein
VGVKSITELSPRHMVIRGESDSVVGPPRGGITPQLLRDKEGLLHLGAAQEPELELHHLKQWSASRGSPASVKSGGCVATKSL